MIEEIHIRDLGVITDAVLPLGPGLSILSGETGAGKTMVVTALGMLLGRRVDSGAVRTGADKALAEAVVVIPENHPAVKLTEDAGGDVDRDDVETADGHHVAATLQLSRTVAASGRSRAHMGGRSAPVTRLSEIGETLVAVHGQSDQLRLKSAAAQRHALDTYTAAQEPDQFVDLLDIYRQKLREFEQVGEQLHEIRDQKRQRVLEAQSLQGALEDIDAVSPTVGEDLELDQRAQKLIHVESLRQAATAAQVALNGSEDDSEALSAVALIAAAQHAVDQEADADPELAHLAERVRELSVLVNDICADLSAYGAALDEDGPAQLAQVESRRAAVKSLIRLYGADLQEVLEFAQTARERLATLVDDPQREEQLDKKHKELRSELDKYSLSLLHMRQAAAANLCAAVQNELTALAMPNAALVVEVSPTENFDHNGRDKIEFLLQPHAEAVPRALGKGASGGELSRLMLAIEVVLAAVDPVPTFVFDEVDSGVGGKAAVEIGRRLKMLAQHVQVLVVTHLPQVAAFADRHILVSKSADSTVSDVRVLTQQERVVELARMLAGHEDSKAARDHAQELLDAATLPASQD